ncbi:MAG: MATE family efflux transporter [Burkholderiaceae bacterium]
MSTPSASDKAHAAGYWQVLLLALPIVLSNLSVPLVGLVDTAVVGRLEDPANIGAVALGAVTFSSIFWAFGFLRMGTTGLAAQAWGRQDGQAIRSLLVKSGALVVFFSALLLIGQSAIGILAISFMGATDTVAELLAEYIRVRIWSAPAVLANYLLMGLFIGLQRTGLALVSQLVLNLTNAALSIVFVLGWGWGVYGVALASVVGEVCSLLIGLIMAARLLKPMGGRWRLSDVTDWPGYHALMSVNLNIFLRTLCLLFAFAWFARQGTALGATVLAVNAILLQFLHLLSYGLDGFAHAAEALVGQAVGARSRRALRAAIKTSTVWAFFTALVYALVYAWFGTDIVAILTTIDTVRMAAHGYLGWIVAIPLIAVWSYQLDGIFVGMLRTAQMRNAMLVSTVIFVPLAWFASDAGGNHGLWLALVVFFVLRAITLAWSLRYGQPPVSTLVDD